MKENYKISINGCDDSTHIEMDLDRKEADLVREISRKSKEASTYGCMPTIEIEKAEGGENDE